MSNSAENAAKSSRIDWVLLVLLAVSLTCNVVLGVAAFRGYSNRAGTPTTPAVPVPGTTVPPIDVQRHGGSRVVLPFSPQALPVLLYTFQPACHWCERNLDNLKAVLRAASATHRIVLISLDPNVGEYVRQADLDVPVYVEPSAAMRQAYGLGPTPQTLVISPEGKVLKSWVGAYARRTQEDIERYFNVKLPGVKAVVDSSEARKGERR